MFECFQEQLVLFGEKTVFSNAQLYLRNTCTTFSVSMLSHIRYGVYVGFALSNSQCFEVFGFSCCVVFNALWRMSTVFGFGKKSCDSAR